MEALATIILAHVPVDGLDLRSKAIFVATMTRRVLMAMDDEKMVDDRDYVGNNAQGGTFHFTTIDVPPMGVLDLAGTFLDIDFPTRIRYTWRWETDLGHESTVTVNFRETGAGRIEVRVNHTGFRDAGDRSNHVIGWNDCIDRLEALLAA